MTTKIEQNHGLFAWRQIRSRAPYRVVHFVGLSYMKQFLHNTATRISILIICFCLVASQLKSGICFSTLLMLAG
ncbi:hypothetical protein EJD97_003559 [Solanum chilense]|uniref:Uncharacterized protein n=1 Tax=Solanum chilense TaxID=4083 RepID=A0A6N2BVT0_SOLCI|nr:hypothetical protein EJD97_003559 [Solanum chilense]